MSSKSWRAVCKTLIMQPVRVRMVVTLYTLWLGLFCLASSAADGWAAASDDAFVAGYATAVLERELNVRAPSLRVTDGLVTVTAEDLAGADREEVLRRLSSIRGVLRVVVQSADPASPDPAVHHRPATPGRRSGPWQPRVHVGPLAGRLAS